MGTTPAATATFAWVSNCLENSRLPRCFSAGGKGALMVARVDGIVVGSTEVTSAEPADYVFAAPALSSC